LAVAALVDFEGTVQVAHLDVAAEAEQGPPPTPERVAPVVPVRSFFSTR
jgi:leucyl aminopeptidase